MAYPTTTELQTFLKGARLITDASTEPDSDLDYAGAIALAVSAWENATNYIPFQADGSDVTAYCKPIDILFPPNEYPFLPLSKTGSGGWISVTSVTVGITSTFAGTVLTAGTDYVLQPKNAALNSKPYTRILFQCPSGVWTPFSSIVGGDLADSIKIIGKRGYQATIDATVKAAVLRKAASQLAGEIFGKLSGGGISEWKQGDTMTRYSIADLMRLPSEWDGVFSQTVTRYRRTILA